MIAARRHAIHNSLFEPQTLQGAIDRLGFVQADPIRSPARAQDLILRHRVGGYRAGDLEREYGSLDVEEDYLYAYGFVSRRVWNLLHPRSHSRMRRFEEKVLDVVRASGEVHPAALEAHLGRRRVINAWGGYSKATTQALEDLHYRGLVRIARRESGIRIYRPASPPDETVSAGERLKALVMTNAAIFAPAPLRTLQAVVARYTPLGNPRRMIGDLMKSGELQKEVIDGISYVWPSENTTEGDVPRIVRFLAPFDPVVWDRARFEHFWGWAYRFEAYTPIEKRVRGYYAMPLLWVDEIVGWVNVALRGARRLSAGAMGANGAQADVRALDVSVGFAGKRPRDKDFTRELDEEIGRMETFLRQSEG
jgi:uncharacterized protein YcaQ